MDKNNIYIIIPALNPDNKTITLIKELKLKGYEKILLVDDGSKEECKEIFKIARDEFSCEVISHYKNMGKGRALKYAFNHLLTSDKEFSAVVTVDCDGQHSPNDVSKLVEKYETSGDGNLILGVREFDKKVPLKSSFGNKMTRSTMALFCGVKVSDANTGLRLFPKPVMAKFLDTAGDRFQYEINMLLETKDKDIGIVEVPIQTIYYENNKSTHFRPFVDSFRIYSLFLKYIFASTASFLVDFLLFALFLKLTKNIEAVSYIILSTIFARVISSIFNFIVNKKQVFRSDNNTIKTAVYYFGLVVFTMFASGILVDVLVNYASFNALLAKILVDSVLFVINFVIQRDLIFKKRKK